MLSQALALAQTSEEQRREAQRDFEERQARSNSPNVVLTHPAAPADVHDCGQYPINMEQAVLRQYRERLLVASPNLSAQESVWVMHRLAELLDWAPLVFEG